VHVDRDGTHEIRRWEPTGPGQPRHHPADFGPPPEGPLHQTPRARTPDEAAFLAIGPGAQQWLTSLVAAVGVWLGLAMTEVPHAVISATILPALLADPSTAALIDDQSVVYANLMRGAFPVFMSTGEVLLLLGGLALAGTMLWASLSRAGQPCFWPSGWSAPWFFTADRWARRSFSPG